MLTDTEFTAWRRRLELSEDTVALIARIRASAPSRLVRPGAGNVPERYVSRKMGCVIQAESRTVEGAFVRQCDHDDDVLEFYDQPEPLWLVYRSPTGRRMAPIRTTMDYFLLRRDGAGWWECKPDQKLMDLEAHNPHHYRRDDQGRWRCPPGEDYAAARGLSCHVFPASTINWVYIRNLDFLEDYLRAEAPHPTADATAHVLSLVRATPGLALSELVACLQDATVDDVHALIARREIHVDWRQAPLAEPRRVPVWPHAALARSFALVARQPEGGPTDVVGRVRGLPNETVVWDGHPWTVLNVTPRTVSLRTTEGQPVVLSRDEFDGFVCAGAIVGTVDAGIAEVENEAIQALNEASPAAHEEAMRRYRAIAPILHLPVDEDDGGRSTTMVAPYSTRCRWVEAYRMAERRYGARFAYVGLLHKKQKRGNSSSKLPPASVELMDAFIDKFETIKAPERTVLWGQLCTACTTAGAVAPSYHTFCDRIRRRPRHQQETRRRGHRGAYGSEPFYHEITLTTPRHGERAWHIAHLDHTLLDVETVCPVTGKPLGRAWLSLLMDASTRRILVSLVSYQAPSALTCMLVLRACVQRHGRLPQTLVVDGGPEFKSTQFEQVLARYRVHKRTRPAAKPRFGSVCERLFGTTNTALLHNLEGNTKIMTRVRQVTKSVNPRTHAIWTLEALAVGIQGWIDEVYDVTEHPALGQSPRDAWAQSLATEGERAHMLIPYDDVFIRSMLPTTPSGHAKVQVSRGVKILNLYYWHDAFREERVEGTSVPVLYDPLDAGRALAYVQGAWRECVSEHYALFHGRSRHEVAMASQALRQRLHRHGQRARSQVSAMRLGAYLTAMEDTETQLEHLRAQANRRTFTLIEGGLPLTPAETNAWSAADPHPPVGTAATPPTAAGTAATRSPVGGVSVEGTVGVTGSRGVAEEDVEDDDDVCEEYA